ncbi:pilus assembly protein [Bradyrhizobium sp. URHD0069]|uniref:pilus assembly protein n=1 Tax=Bradyrhizobium sp. URHD0069 TaxID=1380355 RepID=UPI00049815FD|nr:pilus assembly protein [Bradyrhizobium sp. URHD0069]
MFCASVTRHVREAIRRFAASNQGNIAVIFAITLVPLISFVGAAIDYSRANRARSTMQAALDSTALMLSKDFNEGRITASEIEAKAKIYFAELYTNKDSTVTSVEATYTPKDSSGASNVVVTGSGYVISDFIKIAGYPQLNFKTDATASWGTARMRVAMVLDVTGSMASDNKMPNLKTAAKDMITTLSKLNKITGDVYISIIPFSRDVNIGTGSPGPADWVTGWAAWEAEPAAIVPPADKITNWKNYGPGSACPFRNKKFQCVETRVSGSNQTNKIPNSGDICPGVDSGTTNYYNGCYTSVYKGTSSDVTLCTGSSGCSCNNAAIDGVGSGDCSCTGSGSSKVCKQTLRDYDHTWQPNLRSTWNGCVKDREQNYDTTIDEPKLGDAATQFVVEQYKDCPKALTPMSNQWTALTTSIDALSPAGNTNQQIGAAWGGLSLSVQKAPLFPPAKDSGYTYNDYLVLVSDGINTENRFSNKSWEIDARQKMLCDNLKKAPHNIKIFALQINTSTTNPDPISAVLQDCGKGTDGTDNFQMITSAADTASAFQNITTQLSKLRVTR